MSSAFRRCCERYAEQNNENHIRYFDNPITIQNNPGVVERLIAQAISNAS